MTSLLICPLAEHNQQKIYKKLNNNYLKKIISLPVIHCLHHTEFEIISLVVTPSQVNTNYITPVLSDNEVKL